MRITVSIALIAISIHANAQVFNQGYTHASFKNLLTNGITYIKSSNAVFDSVMIETLEKYWTISTFTTIERYKEPEQNSTAFFVTSQKPIRDYQQDRKNPRIITLLPAMFYDEGADYEKSNVDIDKTLGYMYFNGFHDKINRDDEYRYLKMMVVALNEGLTQIKDNNFTDVEEILNQNISQAIIDKYAGNVGNTLIIHRDQTVHAIDMERVKASGIRYRLLADDEYEQVIEAENPEHCVLYFGNNKYTEISLIRIKTGEIIYTKHLHNDVMTISKKELKAIFTYFK